MPDTVKTLRARVKNLMAHNADTYAQLMQLRRAHEVVLDDLRERRNQLNRANAEIKGLQEALRIANDLSHDWYEKMNAVLRDRFRLKNQLASVMAIAAERLYEEPVVSLNKPTPRADARIASSYHGAPDDCEAKASVRNSDFDLCGFVDEVNEARRQKADEDLGVFVGEERRYVMGER
jgi:hypothetical protein